MYKLGIDVGGTNTDAVLIDKNLNIIAVSYTHLVSQGHNSPPKWAAAKNRNGMSAY